MIFMLEGTSADYILRPFVIKLQQLSRWTPSNPQSTIFRMSSLFYYDSCFLTILFYFI